METIGLRELNQNPSKAVARVPAGVSLIVTDRGKPVLRMVPETEHPSTLQQADAAGVPATALIRGWVEDRLVAQETGDIGRDQLVAALRSVLADLDPLRAHLADSA